MACRRRRRRPAAAPWPAGSCPPRWSASGRKRGSSSAVISAARSPPRRGLRGQRVHRLRAGYARDRLHGEARDARLGQRLGGVAAPTVAGGSRWSTEAPGRIRPISSALGGATLATTSPVKPSPQWLAPASSNAESETWDAAPAAGLHDDVHPGGGQLLDDLRDGGDPALASGGLLGNGKLHRRPRKPNEVPDGVRLALLSRPRGAIRAARPGGHEHRRPTRHYGQAAQETERVVHVRDRPAGRPPC